MTQKTEAGGEWVICAEEESGSRAPRFDRSKAGIS